MQRVNARFTDFDHFKQFAIGWDLDFKLLSRNDFNAHLNIYSNENFQLGRTSLRGTIHQNGLAPEGFRTIVLPASPSVCYNWLHKDVDGRNLLIFPRNRTLESVSFDNFDVYVFSIAEQRLTDLIESFGFIGAESAFEGSEKYLHLDPNFLQEFLRDAEMFFQFSNAKQTNLSATDHQFVDSMINEIFFKLLKYIDGTNEVSSKNVIRKRDKALKRSLNYISEGQNRQLSVKELCLISNVSERTLEYAFLEKFQVSPNQYLKAHRLNLVKQDLWKRRGQKYRISDVAAKFGFYHMGQFSADFKRHFGINPSRYNKRISI